MSRYASFPALIFSNILRFVYKTDCKGTNKNWYKNHFGKKKLSFYEKIAKMREVGEDER